MTSGVLPRTSNADLYLPPQPTTPPPLQKGIHLLDNPLLTDKSMDALNEMTAVLMSNFKSGEVTTFLKTGGWDFSFFMWAMAQNRLMLDDHTFYSCPGMDLACLREHFEHYPKSVIFTNSPLDPKLKIPKESIVIRYCPEPNEPGITLPTLDEEIAVGALSSWIADQKFAVGFEGDTVRAFCQLAQKKKTKSAFSWIKVVGGFGSITPFNISPSKTTPGNFFISSKDKTDVSLLQKVAQSINVVGFKTTIGAEPSVPKPLVIRPHFLTHIPPRACTSARMGQVRQLKAALTGRDAGHALVIGSSRRELGALLASLFKEPPIKLDMSSSPPPSELGMQAVTYINSHPGAIIYIPRVGNLKPIEDIILLAKAIKKNPFVLHITHEELSTIDIESELFEKFKKVSLTPLDQKQCLMEITTWAEKEKLKIPPQSLEIAVALSFLLHNESGAEFMFAIDLLERTLSSSEASPTDLWETFILMYRQFEKEHEVRSRSKSRCRSLFSISMSLKKQFGIDLPVKKVIPTEPPYFLEDLNAKVKGLAQFVVPLQSRLDDLEDALKGQYKNALIVGDSGVGKTKLVEHAAWMSVHGKLDPTHPLFGRTIYVLDKEAMMDDSRYLGTLEGRVNELFNFILHSGGAVFVDEMHVVMGAGVTIGNESGSIAQYMKTDLEESGVMVIGATTLEEYRRWVATDHAFVRRFNTFKCENPTDEEAIQIFKFYLSGLKELHPTLALTDQNIQTVLQIVKATEAKISLVDRGKKLMEAIAKAAKRVGRNEVDDDFIGVVAKKLIF